jgi:formamidopyrimidine-DNA glycosylase
VGNIYADEALWRAELHGARPAAELTRPVPVASRPRPDVMREALRQGGTSFDALYVNVNGGERLLRPGPGGYGREANRAAAVAPRSAGSPS